MEVRHDRVAARRRAARSRRPPSFTAQRPHLDADDLRRGRSRLRGFWAEQAGDLLDWFEPWHTVLEWDLPFAKWFVGGKLNASYNCLDRHVDAGHGDKVAYHWEGEPGDTRTITYARAPRRRVAGSPTRSKELGVEKGDRVNIYLGHGARSCRWRCSPARASAPPHSVVFGGFSSDSLRDRIQDAEAKVLITGDGAWRRGSVVPLKETADTAVAECPIDREGARAAPHRARRRR